MEQKKNEKLLVHLINYNVERHPTLNNIEVDLRVPEGRAVERISVLSPDEEKDQSLNFTTRNKRIVFTVPMLATYALVVVKPG